jgi:hypothetical protein
MIVMRNMDELMELDLPEEWIAAVHVCACNPKGLAHYPKDWWVTHTSAQPHFPHPMPLQDPRKLCIYASPSSDWPYPTVFHRALEPSSVHPAELRRRCPYAFRHACKINRRFPSDVTPCPHIHFSRSGPPLCLLQREVEAAALGIQRAEDVEVDSQRPVAR